MQRRHPGSRRGVDYAHVNTAISPVRRGHAPHALTRDGVPIDLSPRHVQVLAHLLSHPGKVIAKNALLDTVWANVFVTENNLEQAIGAIRKAVDDDAAAQRLIQTVKRKGYRFVGAVDATGAPPQRDAFDDWMKGRLSLEPLNAGESHVARDALNSVQTKDVIKI